LSFVGAKFLIKDKGTKIHVQSVTQKTKQKAKKVKKVIEIKFKKNQ